MNDYAGVADQLFDVGYAPVQLTRPQLDTLTSLNAAAADFFTRTNAEKRSYGSSDFNFGFRPFGRQYSITPDRPDMNESFTYWGESPDTIPHHTDVSEWTQALARYRVTVAALTAEVLTQMATHYAYQPTLSFGTASYLEVNWYLRSGNRDLLQDRHEDGHLLTIATSDGPGLEIETAFGMEAVSFGEGELLIMPGSLLTDMTGGDVRPLYHQVRNHRCERRVSVLYLVNPKLDAPVAPYSVTDRNRGVDIAERARKNGHAFGLPEAPILSRCSQATKPKSNSPRTPKPNNEDPTTPGHG